MKLRNITTVFLALSIIAISCQQVTETPFELDTKEFSGEEIGPDGGVRKISVKSSGRWTASTTAPWITISPANGNSSTECRILVDSTLQTEPRAEFVQFKLENGEYREFEVKQKGYDYAITLKEPTVEIPEFADSDSRTFDVVVKSNTEFTVVIPDVNPSGLTCKVLSHEFDRGVRPRNVTVRFNWRVNSRPDKHETLVTFKPVNNVDLAQNDPLKVVQKAAQAIIPGTAAGDSLALLAIQRNMNVWSEFDTAEKMENWENVTVWRSGENKGRVRSARFFLFRTKEALPYEVKYLTAAEELYFYGNENSFLLDNLSCGEDICELTNLRRLTIGSYGLTELPKSFDKLDKLEYLDLSGNNFNSLPDVLNGDALPSLTALIMNANQRHVASDLSNNKKENCGGLINECPIGENGQREFPRRLLKWNKLDTLRLSVNYLQGVIPDLSDDPDFEKWTQAEIDACDTLPQILVGMPKVLPDTDFFAINLNRLHGNLPDWFLYHPKLDIWDWSQLVFPQEGKDEEGNLCGFPNAWTNLTEYYNHYTNKKYNPKNVEDKD